MPTELLIMLPVSLAVISAAIMTAVKAPQLGAALRIFAALVFVPWAFFSLFGFAAAMEPGDNHVIWRVGYAASFLACLCAMGRLVFSKSVHAKIDQD